MGVWLVYCSAARTTRSDAGAREAASRGLASAILRLLPGLTSTCKGPARMHRVGRSRPSAERSIIFAARVGTPSPCPPIMRAGVCGRRKVELPMRQQEPDTPRAAGRGDIERRTALLDRLPHPLPACAARGPCDLCESAASIAPCVSLDRTGPHRIMYDGSPLRIGGSSCTTQQ